MQVTRAYKTELDLTKAQVTACKQHAGAARFAYNWGLAQKQERYKATGYEFKRQLLYKARWYGSNVILASRWEPSSKTCSGCGWVDDDLMLADRTFHCEQCGLVIDRDLNAALNLAKLAGSSSDSLNACGAGSAGPPRKRRVKLPAKAGAKPRKKQELDADCPPGIKG